MRDDYQEALNTLHFSPEAKQRMVRNLEAAPEAAKPNERRRFFAVGIAAAILTFVVGCTAYTAGAFVGVHDFIEDLFTGTSAQPEIVEKIGRPVVASASSNGVTITADAIVGDQKHCAIVFSLAKDDGTPFEQAADLLDDSCVPVFCGTDLFKIGNFNISPQYDFYDADPSDNAIQCVVRYTIGSHEDTPIGKTMHATLGDLVVLKSDDKGRPQMREEVVAKGSWELWFSLDYEDMTKKIPGGQAFKVGDTNVKVESVLISPISVFVNYIVDTPMMSQGESSIIDIPAAVNLRDGTVIDVPLYTVLNDSGASSQYADVMFDELVDLNEVESVTVGDVEIPVS